jgi:hypothetical protein
VGVAACYQAEDFLLAGRELTELGIVRNRVSTFCVGVRGTDMPVVDVETNWRQPRPSGPMALTTGVAASAQSLPSERSSSGGAESIDLRASCGRLARRELTAKPHRPSPSHGGRWRSSAFSAGGWLLPAVPLTTGSRKSCQGSYCFPALPLPPPRH